jgi:hypothetical protein
MIVKTESGSAYEFNEDETQFRRINAGGEYHKLRRDGEWLNIKGIVSGPTVGEPLVMVIEIRDDGVPTFRRTSHVVEIING